jgi:hypothetical protein
MYAYAIPVIEALGKQYITWSANEEALMPNMLFNSVVTAFLIVESPFPTTWLGRLTVVAPFEIE